MRDISVMSLSIVFLCWATVVMLYVITVSRLREAMHKLETQNHELLLGNKILRARLRFLGEKVEH